jgi:acyl-CoA synthetase (AMP-forming)/AMP-acid ligase II
MTATIGPDASVGVESAQGLERSRELVLGAVLERAAARWPNRVALVLADQRLTFAELNDRANALAAYLSARGVHQGDRIAVLLPNSVEHIDSFFAAARIGAIWVPVNIRLAKAELVHVIQHSASVALITDDTRWGALSEELDTVRTTLLVDGAGAQGAGYDDALSRFAGAAPPETVVEDSDPAIIMYTSGTTGVPKGVLIAHKSLAMNSLNRIAAVGVGDDSVLLSGLPLFHIGGINSVVPLIERGRPSVVLPTGRFTATIVAHLAAAERATILTFVPAQYEELVKLDEGVFDTTGIRSAVWGASPASRELLEAMAARFPRAATVASFGQTEVGNATFMPPGRDREKLGSVGVPAPGFDIRIVDEELNELSAGQRGEIVYRGPQVMLGYYKQPEATAEAFSGGWLHSGDVGVFDEDGFLWIVDRKKDMIISGGENIYPAEVEQALIRHPAVAEVAVVGVPDERWGETPRAFVVLQSGSDVGESELIGFCAEHIARYKLPTSLEFVEALPRNALGKVLKHQLRSEARA